MRGSRLALVSLVLATSSLACGASKPPEAPTTSSTSGGASGASASAIVPDAEADATITADLAGMRANPLFARAAHEAGADDPALAALAALVDKIDHVELRASLPKDSPPAIVGVLWGKLGTDPRRISGLGVAIDEAQSLPSGVKEYAVTGGQVPARVFVLDDGVWIIATGANIDRVRARVTSSAATPSAPAGDLLHLRANGAVLAHAPKELPSTYASVQKVDVSLTSGASSLRAVLSFKEADGAKRATSELRMLGAFLLLAIKSKTDCKALEKISFDVKNDARDVAIEVNGISDAIAAWDPDACKMEARGSHEPPHGPRRSPSPTNRRPRAR